jgi:hypothetical protein
MNPRSKWNNALGLAGAILLAGSLGLSASDVKAIACDTPRSDTAILLPITASHQTCDDSATSESARGRPGLRFLPE